MSDEARWKTISVNLVQAAKINSVISRYSIMIEPKDDIWNKISHLKKITKRRQGPKFTMEKPKKYKNMMVRKTVNI